VRHNGIETSKQDDMMLKSFATLRRNRKMPKELEKLIETAKSRAFPTSEREAQRRSFAYGNTKIENPRITRQTVDEQADQLKSRIENVEH